MPRYMLEPPFPQGIAIPVAGGGADICHAVVEHNVEEGVTLARPYVRAAERTTFCIYDASSRRRSARPPLPRSCPSIRSHPCT